MGRVSINKSGSYGSATANGFFSLADDKDSAVVTFLYEEEDGSDMDYFVVHQVEVDNRNRYINCNAISEDGKVFILKIVLYVKKDSLELKNYSCNYLMRILIKSKLGIEDALTFRKL